MCTINIATVAVRVAVDARLLVESIELVAVAVAIAIALLLVNSQS
jgi:hypothetical protein